MKLILSTSLVQVFLATSSSAQSFLPSALRARNLIKDTTVTDKNTDKNTNANANANANFKYQPPSLSRTHGIRGIRPRQRSAQEQEVCEGQNSDALRDEFDRLLIAYYDEIVCTDDSKTDCTWDASPLIPNGAFDVAINECENGGGVLYTFKSTISCADGSSITFIDIPWDCNSNCGDGEYLEGIVPYYYPAVQVLGNLGIEKETTCSYDSFSVDALPSDSGTDDNEGPDEDDDGEDEDDFFGDTCATEESPAYDDLFQNVFAGSGSFDCNNDGSVCTFDMSSAIEDGGAAKLNDSCTSLGGSLFIVSVTVSCSDSGVSNVANYDSFPFCMNNCSLDLLKLLFVEGGPAGDDCIFTDVAEIYAFGELEDDDGSVVEDDIVSEDDGTDGDDMVVVEDDDGADGICKPVEDSFGDGLGKVFFESASFTCEPDDNLKCMMDFSSAYEEGGMDMLHEICTGLGADFYVASIGITCDNGSSTYYKSLPTCFENCSMEILTTYVFVEGGDAGEGDGQSKCTFAVIDDISLFDTPVDGDDAPVDGDDTPFDDGTAPVDGDDVVTEDDTPDGDDTITKVTKAPKMPKMPKMPEVTKAPKIPKVVKQSKMPKVVTKQSKMPKGFKRVPKMPKLPKVPKND